jgi:hypothetical protein
VTRLVVLTREYPPQPGEVGDSLSSTQFARLRREPATSSCFEHTGTGSGQLTYRWPRTDRVSRMGTVYPIEWEGFRSTFLLVGLQKRR